MARIKTAPGAPAPQKYSPKVNDVEIFGAFLRRGYLPEVFPLIFSTKAWADSIDPSDIEINLQDKVDLNRISYSCTKRGYGRRYFDLVHPASAVATSAWMSRHWQDVLSYCNEKKTAPIELSLLDDESNRSVSSCSFDRVLLEAKKRLAGARYVVRADIAKYYSSIYTHAIPWALHGKDLAKADRKATSIAVFANDLDWAIRVGQGNQTKGIPVGPDFSRVVGELIGVAIDRVILDKIGENRIGYIRNIDDFCVGASDLASAEAILHALQEALHSYELELNDEKTSISEASSLIDESWIHELDVILDGSTRDILKLIDRAFDRAFHLANTTSTDSSLKYLIRTVDRLTSENKIKFHDVEHSVIRSMVSYPHCLDYCVLLFLKQYQLGNVNYTAWSSVIGRELRRHLSLSHDHETSWLLTALIGADVKLGKIEFSHDPNRQISNTLLLRCLDGGHLRFDANRFLEEVVPDTEVNTNWLLCNEVVANGWATSSIRTRIGRVRHRLVGGENVSFLNGAFMQELEIENGRLAIPDRYNRYDDRAADADNDGDMEF